MGHYLIIFEYRRTDMHTAEYAINSKILWLYVDDFDTESILKKLGAGATYIMNMIKL